MAKNRPDELETMSDEADTTLLPEDTDESPPDSAIAVDDYGTTVEEELSDEPLSQRLRREQPDIPRGHRPEDPDRLARTAFPGRLVADGGTHIAEGDVDDFTAEEAAMHLMTLPEEHGEIHVRSHADRLDLLEAQVSVLLTLARIHTDALVTLSEALEPFAVEGAEQAAGNISSAAHKAHELILSLREIPR